MHVKIDKVLLKLRHTSSLTQRDIADKLFVSRSTYNKWEQGNSDIPHSKLFLIARVYGLDVLELIAIIKNENDLEYRGSNSELSQLQVKIDNLVEVVSLYLKKQI